MSDAKATRSEGEAVSPFLKDFSSLDPILRAIDGPGKTLCSWPSVVTWRVFRGGIGSKEGDLRATGGVDESGEKEESVVE